MSDDQLSPERDREIFEAIVSQLQDPELVRLRRRFVGVSVAFFLAGVIGVTVVGGLGWIGLLAFSSTFLPGVVVGQRIHGRRFTGPGHERESRHPASSGDG